MCLQIEVGSPDAERDRQGCNMKMSIIALMLTAVITVSEGVEVIARPNYGVVFTPVTKIQNSGARWMSYLQLPDILQDLVPEGAREDNLEGEICNISPGQISANFTLALVPVFFH